MENSVPDFEKLKLVYEKAAEHHKYYLSWRQFILSGFFAIISVLLLSIYNCYLSPSLFIKCLTPLISIVIVLISIFFEKLDARNKELYQSCQRTATIIEMELFGENLHQELLGNKGLFFDINKSFKLDELLIKTEIKKENLTNEEKLHNFFINSNKKFSKATHSKLFDYFFFTIKLVGLFLFFALVFKIWYINFKIIVSHFTCEQWTGLGVTIFIPTFLLVISNWKMLFKNNHQ